MPSDISIFHGELLFLGLLAFFLHGCPPFHGFLSTFVSLHLFSVGAYLQEHPGSYKHPHGNIKVTAYTAVMEILHPYTLSFYAGVYVWSHLSNCKPARGTIFGGKNKGQ